MVLLRGYNPIQREIERILSIDKLGSGSTDPRVGLDGADFIILNCPVITPSSYNYPPVKHSVEHTV